MPEPKGAGENTLVQAVLDWVPIWRERGWSTRRAGRGNRARTNIGTGVHRGASALPIRGAPVTFARPRTPKAG